MATGGQGQTPLHVAALYSQLATAQLLLDSGANPKAIDAQGPRLQLEVSVEVLNHSTEMTNHLVLNGLVIPALLSF